MWIQSNLKYQDGYIDTVKDPLYILLDPVSNNVYANYFDGAIGSSGRWVIVNIYGGSNLQGIGLPIGLQAMISGNQSVTSINRNMSTFGGKCVFTQSSSGAIWYSGETAPYNPYGGLSFDAGTWYYTGATGQVVMMNIGLQGAQAAGTGSYTPYTAHKLSSINPVGTYSAVAVTAASSTQSYVTYWIPFSGWQLPDGVTSRLGRYVATSDLNASFKRYMYVGFMRLKDTVSGRIFRQYRKNEAFYYHQMGIQGTQGQDFFVSGARVVAKSDDGYYLWSLKNPARFLVSTVLEKGTYNNLGIGSQTFRSIAPVWWASVYDKLETTYDLSYSGFGPRPTPEQMNITIDGYEECPCPQWSIDNAMPIPMTFDAPLAR